MQKILIVDDDESVQLVYREELEEVGYEVYSVFSGEEALKKIDLISPDLVILDIKMPGMDGIDVLCQIKERDSSLPVILSSAYPEFKQDISSWASDDYIVKSANLDTLKESVHKLLS
ncbi:MAG: response regulator [Thermodesulfobacteriota bacterium]